MPPIHIALLSEVEDIGASALQRLAAAIQHQLSDHLGPAWDVVATIHSFSASEDVPLDWWRVTLGWEVPNQPDLSGAHTDGLGNPAAFVDWSKGVWTANVSHEILEMLVDPTGRRTIEGPSIMPGQDLVQYLVEVCDPCQAPDFYYQIDGQRLSTFCLPAFYDPNSSGQCFFKSKWTRPLSVARGGYLSWQESGTQEWWQQTWFSGSVARFEMRGVSPQTGSVRYWIDSHHPLGHSVARVRAQQRKLSDECRAANLRLRSNARRVEKHFRKLREAN